MKSGGSLGCPDDFADFLDRDFEVKSNLLKIIASFVAVYQIFHADTRIFENGCPRSNLWIHDDASFKLRQMESFRESIVSVRDQLKLIPDCLPELLLVRTSHREIPIRVVFHIPIENLGTVRENTVMSKRMVHLAEVLFESQNVGPDSAARYACV